MTYTAYHRRMKFARAIPAIVIAVVLAGASTADGQRGGRSGGGGARGGFSGGHIAPAFHGSGGYVARPIAATRPAYGGRPGYPVGRGVRVVSRGPYNLGYGYGFGYPYGYGLGYYDPAFGYDDSANYDMTGPTPGPYADPSAVLYAEPNTGPYAAEAGPAAGPSYQPAPVYRPAQPAPAPEDAVTLIFKDGRPPLQIHNYALTRTTVYVTDSKHRDIPVADLDLAATVKANADAGVPFQLPGPN